MGMGGNDGVVVEVTQDISVSGIRQVLDCLFQFVADTSDGLVVTRSEEHLNRIGQVQQLVLCAVLRDLLTDA